MCWNEPSHWLTWFCVRLITPEQQSSSSQQTGRFTKQPASQPATLLVWGNDCRAKKLVPYQQTDLKRCLPTRPVLRCVAAGDTILKVPKMITAENRHTENQIRGNALCVCECFRGRYRSLSISSAYITFRNRSRSVASLFVLGKTWNVDKFFTRRIVLENAA